MILSLCLKLLIFQVQLLIHSISNLEYYHIFYQTLLPNIINIPLQEPLDLEILYIFHP